VHPEDWHGHYCSPAPAAMAVPMAIAARHRLPHDASSHAHARLLGNEPAVAGEGDWWRMRNSCDADGQPSTAACMDPDHGCESSSELLIIWICWHTQRCGVRQCGYPHTALTPLETIDQAARQSRGVRSECDCLTLAPRRLGPGSWLVAGWLPVSLCLIARHITRLPSPVSLLSARQ